MNCYIMHELIATVFVTNYRSDKMDKDKQKFIHFVFVFRRFYVEINEK